MKLTRVTFASAFAALCIMAGLIAGFGPRASAQEAADRPAHVHAGACPAPGEVLFPLENVAAPDGEQVGSGAALAVETSETTIDAALEDIVAADHAIVVHESVENIANYIACGDIGGVLIDGTLAIGLAPLNDSGFGGVALLEDDGDGSTTVSIFLTGDAGDAAEIPADEGDEADDADDADDADAATSGPAAVEISDFAFGPDTLEIPVGTTVVWTNNDSAPHTVSQTGGGFDSGKLDEGQTFRFTFDEPGTFEYFCQFHPNMTGTIIVS